MQRAESPKKDLNSPFIKFLTSDDTELQIIKNLSGLSESKCGEPVLSRIFNDTPRAPLNFKVLVSYFIDAWKNQEIEAWYNLFLSTMINDLLDSDGDLKKEIVEFIKELPMSNGKPLGDKGWALLCKDLTPIQAAKNIMVSCILMYVSGGFYQEVARSLNPTKGTLDCFSADDKRRFIDSFKTSVRYYQNHNSKFEITRKPEGNNDPSTIIDEYEANPTDSAFTILFSKCINYEIQYQLDKLLHIEDVDAFQLSKDSIRAYLNSYVKEVAQTKGLKALAQSHLASIAEPASATKRIEESDTYDEDEIDRPSVDVAKLVKEKELAEERSRMLDAKLRKMKTDFASYGPKLLDAQTQVNTLTAKLKEFEKDVEAAQQETRLAQFLTQEAQVEKEAADREAQASRERAVSSEKRADEAEHRAEAANSRAETAKLNAELATNKTTAAESRAVAAERDREQAIAGEFKKNLECAALRAALDLAESDLLGAKTQVTHLQSLVGILQKSEAAKERQIAELTRAKAALESQRQEDEVQLEAIEKARPPQADLRELILKSQNAEIDPENIKNAIIALTEYQDYLARELDEHNLTLVLDHTSAAEDVAKNPDNHSWLSDSMRKAYIKYHSCVKLKDALQQPGNSLDKSVRFGRELVMGDHLNKLQLSRTSTLGWAIKILLAPFTFFQSLKTYQSSAGKKAVASIHTLFTPTVSGMVKAMAHKKENEGKRKNSEMINLRS